MNPDRVQDVWRVEIAITAATDAMPLPSARGFLDLPRPMTAFNAADYAVRLGVQDAIKAHLAAPGSTVTARVSGKSLTSPGLGSHQCVAVAEFDAALNRFMRQEPWRGDGCRADVQTPDGAKFVPDLTGATR